MIFSFLKSSYQKVKTSLRKAGSLLGERLRHLFQGKLDEELFEKLEKLLYEADLGIELAELLTQKMKEVAKKHPEYGAEELLESLKKEALKLLQTSTPTKSLQSSLPYVLLIVGVNGNGKTTSVAKLAKRLQNEGNSLLLVAGDTFRAAATEQLQIWAERLGVPLVKGHQKSDPSAVVFDALTSAKSQQISNVIIDTAGRLHTKGHLMQELQKMVRTCQKVIPGAPHEVLLVLDATTGQNALEQAKVFHRHTQLSGIILTKLDGTAKGGVVLNLHRHLQIPIRFIGVGEGIEDLVPFDPESFIQTLFD